MIGQNPPDFGRRNQNIFWTLGLVEALHGSTIEEIKFRARANNKVAEAAPVQFPPQGTAYESPVAGDINPGIRLKFHGATIPRVCGRDKGYGQRCINAFENQ